jgi:hypothetical protein
MAIAIVLIVQILETGLRLTVVPTPIPYNPADYYGMQVDVVNPAHHSPKWHLKKHWGL